MKQKKMFAVLTLGVLLFAGIGSVMAYRGDATTVGPNYSEARHSAMTEAFSNNDYYSWFELMQQALGNHRVTEKINVDNFDVFSQMHNAMLSGDTETADELRASLGLGQGNQRRGVGSGQRGQGYNGNCPYGN